MDHQEIRANQAAKFTVIEVRPFWHAAAMDTHLSRAMSGKGNFVPTRVFTFALHNLFLLKINGLQGWTSYAWTLFAVTTTLIPGALAQRLSPRLLQVRKRCRIQVPILR